MSTRNDRRVTGNLATMSLADLLQWAGRGRKTGTLHLRDGRVAKQIAFRNGDIVGSSSNDPRDYLGQVLISEGVITERQLKEAMELQARTRTRLGRIIVHWGLATESHVAAILKQKAEETIYSLFLWGDAEFEFVDGDDAAASEVPIGVSVESVLLEGLRRYDTSVQIRKIIPHGRIILRRTGLPLSQDLAARPFPRRIYDLMDGHRTLAEVILEAHASEFSVSQVAYVLVRRRHLVIAGEASSDVGGTGARDAVATAREALERGEAEEALVLLDHLRDAGQRTPEILQLTQEAERYFVERAYRYYLPPAKVPVLRQPLESLTGVPLSPEEVFLVTRVNGTWDLRSIMSISPLREVDALRALKRLRERGVIDLVDAPDQKKVG